MAVRAWNFLWACSALRLNGRVLFRKVAIVGVGLLGGSLGLALRSRHLVGEVCGYLRRDSAATEATTAGVVDRATTDLAAAVRDADLVVLCVPVGSMESTALALRGFLSPGAVVTDVGSVKGAVVDRLESIVHEAGGVFVGCHPMAGSEKTGFGSARADLFDQAVCVVTPTSRTPRGAIERVESLWSGVGGRVVTMTPERHDLLVSRASHLPHVVAAGLARWILDPGNGLGEERLCATGFRDTTRLASGSPELWRDIALANRVPLDEAIAGLTGELERFREALRKGDAASVEAFFAAARDWRESWVLRGSPSPLPSSAAAS
ncbi:MAG: hypothetical protein RLZ45_877 [Verrucomicrobiota bacterium]|jgi:prephenate dehydrogenase